MNDFTATSPDVASVSTRSDSGRDSDAPQQLASAESTAVRWSKKLVLVVLMIAAASTVAATFFVTRSAEIREFRSLVSETAESQQGHLLNVSAQFTKSHYSTSTNHFVSSINELFDLQVKNHAEEIIALSELSRQNIVATFEGVSEMISSSAIDLKMKWPFVVVPHFTERTQRMLDITSAESVVLAPFIYSFPPTENPQPSPPKPLYMPLWQVNPVVLGAALVNIDLSTFPGSSLDFENENDFRFTELATIFFAGSGGVDYGTVPTSLLITPVFENVNKMGRKVGLVTLAIPWSTFFTNILSDKHESMTVYISNSCGDGFTFRIQGPEVVFHGLEDDHDVKFDDYKYSSQFNDVWEGATEQVLETQCKFSLDL